MTGTAESKISRLATLFSRLTLCSGFLLVPLIFYFSSTRQEYNHQVYDVPKMAAWALILTAFVSGSALIPRRTRDGVSVLLSVLLFGIWLSCFQAVNLGMALADAVFVSLLIAVPLVTSRSFDSGRALGSASSILLAGGVLAVVYALAQRLEWDPILTGFVGLSERYQLGSSLGSPSRVALYVAALIPVLTACFLSVSRGATRGILALIGIAFVFVLFIGRDRIAFVVAFVGSLFLLLWIHLARRRWTGEAAHGIAKRLDTPLIVLLCIVLAAGIAVAPADSGEAADVGGDVVRASRRLALHNPLLGVGSGNWGIVFPLFDHAREYGEEISPKTGPPPPDIWRIWGEWGALGIIGFLGSVLWLLGRSLRVPTNEPGNGSWVLAGSSAGLAGLFGCALFGSPLSIPAVHFLFWSLAGIALAASRTGKTRAAAQLVSARRTLLFRAAAALLLAVVGVAALGRVVMPLYVASHHHLKGIWWTGLSKARGEFEKAIELVPYHPMIWADFADSSVRLVHNEDPSAEKYEEYALLAEEVGLKALRYFPNEAALLFRYGNALDFQLGRPWEKVIAYRHATELSPGTALFHLALGRAYIQLSAYPYTQELPKQRAEKRAVKEWQTALDLDPDNPSAAYNLALQARNRFQTQEALDYLGRILRKYPNHKKARELLEEFGYRMDDVKEKQNLEQIARYWQAQIEKNPRDPGNYLRAGRAYEELGNDELAVLMYKKAFLQDPEYVPAVKKLKALGISLERLLREGEAGLLE
jgi:tetratricopeptide (TPR) repeat protein